MLEKSNRTGGVVQSLKRDGYLLEWGPNTIQAQPQIWDLIDDLNLQDEALLANVKIPRYINWANKLHQVPLSPRELLSTSLLSTKAKFGLIKEVFNNQKSATDDESVYDFFSRRLGDEWADKIISPFISGIWAGDAKALSIKSTFPKLYNWDKSAGSLIRGMIKHRPKSTQNKFKKGLLSFRNGVSTLTDAISAQLKNELILNCENIQIMFEGPNHWVVRTNEESFKTNSLTVSVPAFEAASLFKYISSNLSESLISIPYISVIILHLGFNETDIQHPLKGFGYLNAPLNSSFLLGCLWSSSIFPRRAPQNHHLLTCFLGGATRPDIFAIPDNEIINNSIVELNSIFGIKGRPSFSLVTKIEKAIPQYTVGHDSRIQQIHAFENAHPGIKFIGNYRDGIAVGDVIKNAIESTRV
jgi:oxygen-dependent protoporphyrinogen oxidase